MEPFKLGNADVKFHNISGKIIDTGTKYSETHVSSTGGGGYVGRYGGNIDAPTLHSSATTNQEFWIKNDDGKEIPIQLNNSDIPIREGHRVTIVLATAKEDDESYYCLLVNHGIGKHWLLQSDSEIQNHLKWNMTIFMSIFTFFSICVLGVIPFGAFIGSIGSAVFLIAIFFCTVLFTRYKQASNIENKVKFYRRHLEKVAQSIY